jgi:hypothetical protein
MNGIAAAMTVIHHFHNQPLAKYPESVAGSDTSPLVYAISLGRYDGSLAFNWLVINGVLAALVKWVIEWTKVCQMEGRPFGQLLWHLGDEFTFLLSRTVIKPKRK